jgi:hypothetical protein
LNVKLPTSNPGLKTDANGLDVKLPTSNPGLKTDANGLDVKLYPIGGLATNASGLHVKSDKTLVVGNTSTMTLK